MVRHWARAEDEKVVKYFKKLGNTRVLFYTRVVKYLPGGKVLSQKRKYFTRGGKVQTPHKHWVFRVLYHFWISSGGLQSSQARTQRTAALWPRGFTSTVISLLLERLESMSSVYLMSIRPPASPRLVESSLVNTPSVKVP